MSNAASIFIALLTWPLATPAYSTSPLSEDIQWIRLLRYEKNLFGQWKSRVQTPSFFVDAKGPGQPQIELERLREALENWRTAPDHDRHPRCLFPVRSQWLADRLDLVIPPTTWCPQLTEWRQRVKARSVTFVFSSYYMNNPSSTYGHTLLRLNRQPLNELKGDNEGRQLLDYGVNYGAIPTTENPVLYALFGLAGVFSGNFLALPYYYKVREYNDFEARDLWEFDLNFSSEEVDRLVDHLWELGPARFPYYYLTKNCGYEMLALLEAAAPRFDLTEKMRKWVLPADTVKIMTDSGLVVQVHYRPSIATQFAWRLQHLANDQERQAVHALASRPLDPEILGRFEDAAKARILDTSIDLFDLRHSKELLAGEIDIKKTKDRMLLTRSRLPTAEPLRIPVPEVERPEASHPSGRLELASVWRNEDQTLIELGYRGALHDLADDPQGYPKNSRIEMGHFRGRYEPKRGAWNWQEVTALRLDSLTSSSRFSYVPAWRADLGIYRLTDNLCDDCLRGRFKGGIGMAWSSDTVFTIFGLVEGDAQMSPRFAHASVAGGLGPAIGLVVRPIRHVNLLAEGESLYYWHHARPKKFDRLSGIARFRFQKHWSAEAAGSWSGLERETMARLNFDY